MQGWCLVTIFFWQVLRMGRYFLKRIGLGLLTVVLSFTITFFLIRLAPGDPIQLLAGRENPNPSQIEYVKEAYGLNLPLWQQYLKYLSNLLQGDFGFSFKNKLPVLQIIQSRLRPTLLLTVTTSVVSASLGVFLGTQLVRMNSKKLERFFLGISYFIDAIPTFWLGIILILVFAGQLKLFPTSGMHDVRNRYQGFQRFLDELYHLFLPVMTIVIVQVPIYMRVTRSSILNAMNSDYVKTYRAIGMSEGFIFRRYLLKNSISPIITLFGSSLAFTIAGVALIEIIYAWPGMGRLILQAVGSRDYMLLNGVYLIISLSVIVFMVLIDLVQAFVDPRIRLR